MRRRFIFALVPWLIGFIVLSFALNFEPSAFSRMRSFDQDPSCVLYLDFTKHGSNTARIWDESGRNNHGIITGTIPATYPKLSGIELVSNVGMEIGDPPTEWDSEAVTIASIADPHSGSKSMDILRTGPNCHIRQSFSTFVGRRYKVVVWLKNTAVDGFGDAYAVCGGDYNLLWTGATATWIYKEAFFTATTTTTTFRQYLTNTAGSRGELDDVSVQEVVGYETLGWGFDGVDDFITIADNPTLDITDNLSILGWVYQPMPYYAYTMSKMTGVADSNIAMLVQLEIGITVLANVGTVWSQLGQNIPLTVGKWHCIGFRYNSVSGGLTYLNGVVTGAANGSGVLATNNDPLYIGGNLGSWSKLGWGEVLFFNRLISAQEIRDYYELTRHRYGMDARDILIKYAEEFEYDTAA